MCPVPQPSSRVDKVFWVQFGQFLMPSILLRPSNTLKDTTAKEEVGDNESRRQQRKLNAMSREEKSCDVYYFSDK